MIFQMLRKGAFLFAMLCGQLVVYGQTTVQIFPPSQSSGKLKPVVPAGPDQRLLSDVAQAVIRLDSNGDRTMDAIENSDITLTLDMFEDSSRLTMLCNNSGKPLGKFAQSLAGMLQLSGKVSQATCKGSGFDGDPFSIMFHLHYESGHTSLFYENTPMLPFIVEKQTENDSEIVDREGNQSEVSVNAPQASESEPHPVILNPHRSQASHAAVHFSQGWTPVKLPDTIHADSTFGTIDSTWTFADGVLTLDRKLVLKRDKVEVSEQADFQKWAEHVEDSRPVALRSTLYYPDRNASAGTDVQQKAAALIDEAYREIEANELDKADAALRQTEAIDPGHEILHENKGELAAARGDYGTALAEYRKELEAYPNALFEMGSIAGAQQKLGDRDGAIATLQRWMVADPNSCLAATSLMEQYHHMGRDDLAVWVGDTAMATMTKDAKRGIDFLLMYGTEQMRTGQAGNAKVTLETLLDLTVDDNIVNNAVYLLSEEGLSLDRAEQSAREALTQFDADDSSGALSYSYAGGSQTGLLLATWDTLGWILFKKGDVHEAETYVRAAWRSRQDIAISRHLGEILTAEERPVEAMDVYTLGLAAIAGQTAAQSSKDPDALAVRDALARLQRQGHTTTVKDPAAELLALRTLELGPITKPRLRTPCTVSLTSSQLIIYIPDEKVTEDPIVAPEGMLLAGLFPQDSKAQLRLKGTIQCNKSCSLVFVP